MILVKPKPGTLISLGIFIVACITGGLYGLSEVLGNVHAAWYQYALAFVLLPLGMALLLKLLWGYQYVSFGKQRIQVQYPVRMRSLQYSLNMISDWKEETVKTASGTYREIVIRFTNGRKVRISMQEHLRYREALGYLKKKCRGKFKS